MASVRRRIEPAAGTGPASRRLRLFRGARFGLRHQRALANHDEAENVRKRHDADYVVLLVHHHEAMNLQMKRRRRRRNVVIEKESRKKTVCKSMKLIVFLAIFLLHVCFDRCLRSPCPKSS